MGFFSANFARESAINLSTEPHNEKLRVSLNTGTEKPLNKRLFLFFMCG